MKLKVTESEVSQTIDLKKVTGVDVSRDPELLREIEQAIIDFQVERVQSEFKGYDGKVLAKPYSKTYSESLDFKAAGKSKNAINMTLSGDMMGSIDVLEESGSKIKIGIGDAGEAVKAFAHITGFEGHPTIKDAKKRPFFGVSENELSKILEPFESKIQDLKEQGRQGNQRDEQGRVIRQVRRITDLLDFEET
jgi:hypothetical protein